MCGIAGIWHEQQNLSRWQNPQQRHATLTDALGKLRHRGPDDLGVRELPASERTAALGHTRLSIVDLPGGHQPFIDQENGIQAVCNGEIYNHLAIRSSTAAEYRYRTGSDCETLLPLYREHGEQAVAQLDGMFAFLIHDGEHFYAGRDPIGIKPLYYGFADSTMMFSSEAKGLVDLVESIHAFPIGHYYHSGTGFVPYYQLPDPDESSWISDETEILGRIRQVLGASVRKRLMADVPVGIFLSGGLDSSIVAALARPHVQELHTFAVGMEESADLQAAREVAQYLGTIHHEVVFDAGALRASLHDIIYHLECWDPALIRSAIPNWFVAQLASQTRSDGQYCKVVLTGEGADELFAGYKYMQSIEDAPRLQAECRSLLAGLHSLNLQRVDRMTMAHAIEARVPFLDTAMIDLALHIHPKLKLHATYQREKGLLRKAFEGYLPDEILYRTKTEFGQGSTVGDWLHDIAENEVSDAELAAAQAEEGSDRPSDKEAVYYRKLFDQRLNAEFAKGTIGNWQGPVL